MTTRVELRASIYELIDSTTFPEATVNIWIADAIHDYSTYFPFVQTEEIPGELIVDRQFDLDTYNDAQWEMNPFRIEYPAYEEPPRFLTRLSESHPNFYNGRYFDLRAAIPPKIIFGIQPTAAEYVLVHYQRPHTVPTSDAYELTIPDNHFEALILFCLWRAAQEQLSKQLVTPTTSIALLGDYSLAVERAELTYRKKIEELRRSQSVGGYSGPWSMDHHDRIY